MTTADQEREHWDVLAADPANIGGGEGMPGSQHFIDRLNEWYPSGPGFKYCLDLGCGPGRILIPMAGLHRGDWFAGVDVSAAMLSQIPTRENVSKRLGDGRTIPADVTPDHADSGIDFAWSVLMFQHIPQTAQVGYLNEVGRRLVPGGRFVLQWVDKAVDHDYSHPTPGPMMLRWADDAGLGFRAAWRDEQVDQWVWAVWEKP